MKAIKMVLPVTAILFAVVAAFATTAPESLVKVRVSQRDGACEQEGFCDTTIGTTTCKYQNGTVLLDEYIPSGPSCSPYSAIGTWTSSGN
jgi:hypothetical protein